MTDAAATILAAVLTTAVLVLGGLLALMSRLGRFEGRVSEFMRDMHRRMQHLERKGDERDERNEGRR